MKNKASIFLSTTLTRLLVFCLFFLFISSCLSLKKGYIPADHAHLEFNETIVLEQKKLLFDETKYITNIIKNKKENGNQLYGNDINSLFENLHSHLETDAMLQYKIEADLSDGVIDSLSSFLSLYTSAINYNRLFGANKYLYKTINRGDISLGIPKRLLNKSKRFSKNPKLRKQVENQASTINKLLVQKPDKYYRKSNCIYQTGNFLSGIFGNTVGFFHGKREDQNQNIQLLQETLQPFDIVLSKSRKHLTDKFIPGYFGHSAIWIGNFEQLQKLGLDNSIHVINNKEQLNNEACMLESLRNKTHLNKLETFADGEDYLILRYKNLDKTNIKSIISSLRHIGKKYDFNFNVESPDRLFCTELVFYAYNFIPWEAKKKFNRYTLNPDDIVKQALDNPEFEVALWINNGVDSTKDKQRLIQLVSNK